MAFAWACNDGKACQAEGYVCSALRPFILPFALTPNQIGHQDVADLVPQQPAVAAHWRQHIRASAFGTIHAATFSFARPIGTAMPQPLSYRLASLDPRMIMPAPWDEPLNEEADDPLLQFPTVDRRAKSDRLPVLYPPQREPETVQGQGRTRPLRPQFLPSRLLHRRKPGRCKARLPPLKQ